MGDGSLGYAERLSYRAELGGKLGEPEIADAESTVAAKAARLAKLISEAEHIVAFTGAGISTACGIPDFRGPNGVWTKQRRGEALPKASLPFEHARPSLTHQTLLALQRTGKLKYLVSQNVDSLHLRSGFPRSQLAELHGNCFAERCVRCSREYVRDFELCSVGFKRTGRKCASCKGDLHDHCLDWDNALPEDELTLSESHAAKADLILCLGTSLVITPACDIPLLVLKKRKHKPRGGKLAILNLQATQHDRKASVVVHAKCDEVLSRVVDALGLQLPEYTRTDSLLVSHALVAELSERAGHTAKRTLQLQLASAHGTDCPLPWLAACTVRFSHLDDAAPFVVNAPDAHGAWRCCIPLGDTDEAAWPSDGSFTAELTLDLAPGTTEPPITVSYPFQLRAEAATRRGSGTQLAKRFDLVTCRQSYGSAVAAPPPARLPTPAAVAGALAPSAPLAPAAPSTLPAPAAPSRSEGVQHAAAAGSAGAACVEEPDASGPIAADSCLVAAAGQEGAGACLLVGRSGRGSSNLSAASAASATSVAAASLCGHGAVSTASSGASTPLHPPAKRPREGDATWEQP